jgi:putative ABC transport system substrate-binding protein
MGKKAVVALLVGLTLASFHTAGAQQAKRIPRIGVLISTDKALLGEAFLQGLRELGYVEGKNIAIEWRVGEGKLDRIAEFAADLVRMKVDVIVASSNSAIIALKQATSTIPVVMTTVSDPIGAGFIQSLGRPGGNITGLTVIGEDLSGKRLELLKEINPKITRVAVLRNLTIPTHAVLWKETQDAATSLGLRLIALDIRGPEDIEAAFRAMVKERSEAFMVLPEPITTTHRQKIVDLAAKNRLPGMYPFGDFVEAGGLIYYGPNRTEIWRRSAFYVDKILKGAKPADLPVEQPKKFEFIINLKAAKQIGLTIPPNVLARADKVIK